MDEKQVNGFSYKENDWTDDISVREDRGERGR